VSDRSSTTPVGDQSGSVAGLLIILGADVLAAEGEDDETSYS